MDSNIFQTKLKFIVTYLLPFLAMGISLLSFWQSCGSKGIAERAFRLNVEPILEVIFQGQDGSQAYYKELLDSNGLKVILKNDGSDDISDIVINRRMEIIYPADSTILSEYRSPLWKTIPELRTGTSEVVIVPRDELYRLYDMKKEHEESFETNKVARSSTLFPAITFDISFRRPTDRKKYSLTGRVVFFGTATRDGWSFEVLDQMDFFRSLFETIFRSYDSVYHRQ
ncbi:MAG: hypothetical protein HY033_03050 [Ignavibacteriae bacterium]|nr:hypothetical protein [Ignavibacteriota bacterium]